MKRLLSIILALSMLAAFVPAVSAADTAQPNFTMVYDITGDLATFCGGTAMTAPPTAINTTVTNGFYEIGTGTTGSWNSGSHHFEVKGSANNFNIAMRQWYWVPVKVWVPMAGTYTLKVNFATGIAFSQTNMRVYWNATGGKTTQIGTYTSPVDSYAETESEYQQFEKIYQTPFSKTVTASAPGYYYVVFEADKGNASTEVLSGVYERASFATISLESGIGDGNAIVLGSIDAPFELKKDETKELNASGYLSQTREAVTFKYESSDKSVATVDENGIVTAVGAGEATITATSADDSDNVTVPLTTKVTVTDPTAYSVTYDIGGTIIKYGMQKTSSGTSKLHMSNVKYLHTNGFFEYVAADPTVNGTSGNAEYQSATKTLAMNKAGGYVTFKIDVPYEGDYKLWVDHDLAKEGAFVDVVIDGTTVGTYNCYSASAANNWFGTNNASNHTQSVAKVIGEDGELGEEALFPLTAGEHTITFRNKSGYPVEASKRGSVGTFKLIKGGSSNVLPMHGYATVSNSNGVPVTSLTNGQTATANAAVYTTDGVAAATATTITSSNPGVLAVDGTTVTAVGAGEATINATIEYENETYNIESNKILVTDPAITNDTVSFYANVYGADGVELTIKGDKDATYEQNFAYGNIDANTTVTLTAPTDIEGKTFRGWMRGSKDNGVWISNEPEIELRLLTNTFLTAVYDPADTEDETTVEFWNWSGQYLGSETVDKGTEFGKVTEPKIHDLTGYEFAGWSVADNEIVSELTRAVARFDKIKDEATGEAKKYHVTIPEGVTGGETGDFEFDTKITLESGTDVYWQRDGKTVDYGREYSFYVWDKTTITTSTVGNSGPKVILDKHDDYDTYMIEFDLGNEDAILEAGILFGDNPKVNSFGSKAVAARENLSHGQFTAVANDEADATNAVGYIVYLDGGIARVLYAK